MRPLTVIVLSATVAGLAGCAETSPQWDARFGQSVVATRAAQVMDPQAPMRPFVAPLADGKAVAGAMKNYSESYGYAVKAQPQPVLTLSTTGAR